MLSQLPSERDRSSVAHSRPARHTQSTPVKLPEAGMELLADLRPGHESFAEMNDAEGAEVIPWGGAMRGASGRRDEGAARPCHPFMGGSAPSETYQGVVSISGSPGSASL